MEKNKEMKDFINELQEMSTHVEECISLLEDAFEHNRKKSLDECEKIARDIHTSERILTETLVTLSKDNDSAKSYIPVPGHLERIGDHIEGIIHCLRTKVNGKIIFSDKAMDEMRSLLQRVKAVVNSTSDLILSKNKTISNYVVDSESAIESSANQFATFHEDRMIEGLCLPEASSIYLHVLDALKGIAWHARQIAEKLTKQV